MNYMVMPWNYSATKAVMATPTLTHTRSSLNTWNVWTSDYIYNRLMCWPKIKSDNNDTGPWRSTLKTNMMGQHRLEMLYQDKENVGQKGT